MNEVRRLTSDRNMVRNFSKTGFGQYDEFSVKRIFGKHRTHWIHEDRIRSVEGQYRSPNEFKEEKSLWRKKIRDTRLWVLSYFDSKYWYPSLDSRT